MKIKPTIHKLGVCMYRLDLRGKSFANLLAVVSNGKKSLQFSSYAEAERKANEIAEMIERYGKSKIENLNHVLKDDIGALYTRLAPFNRTITNAVDFYVEHLLQTKKNESTETVGVLVDRWIAAKQIEKDKGTLRPRTLQTLKFFGNKFKAQWSNRRVGTIQEDLPFAAL